jgi:hypothetical protein
MISLSLAVAEVEVIAKDCFVAAVMKILFTSSQEEVTRVRGSPRPWGARHIHCEDSGPIGGILSIRRQFFDLSRRSSHVVSVAISVTIDDDVIDGAEVVVLVAIPCTKASMSTLSKCEICPKPSQYCARRLCEIMMSWDGE